MYMKALGCCEGILCRRPPLHSKETESFSLHFYMYSIFKKNLQVWLINKIN